jgi:hypothetical protein
MKIRIGLAGLPYEVELKCWLACKLLMSSSLPVQLDTWDGQDCDILVANLDSVQGRLAYDKAVHRDTRLLLLGKPAQNGQPAGLYIDPQATASAIAKLLENTALALPGPTDALVQGLLGICLLQGGHGHEVLASHGNLCVMLRDHGKRIYAGSLETLEQAKQQLLQSSWTSLPVTAPCEHQYQGLVVESLDRFLVDACRRHQDKLPMIGEAVFRLSRWPDFIAFPDHREALRLSSALYRKSWRVAQLAEHCGVPLKTANAFCWAMQASGALRLDDSPDASRLDPANEPSPMPFVQRMVNQFAAKLR